MGKPSEGTWRRTMHLRMVLFLGLGKRYGKGMQFFHPSKKELREGKFSRGRRKGGWG